MALPIPIVASLITAGAGLLGRLLGGDNPLKGQPIQYQPMISPQEQALRNAIAQRMQMYLNMPAPPVSPAAYDATNILYNVFLGRPFPNMPTQMPTGNIPMGLPRQPMNWTGLGWSPQVFQNLYNRYGGMATGGTLGGGGLPRGNLILRRGLAF